MKNEVLLNEKSVSVNISKSALNQLKKTSKPLLLEVELYFSCLIKKVCHFRELDNSENRDDYTEAIDGLYLHFRASMTNKCSIDDFDKDKTAEFPLVNQKPYIPKWVNIDYSSNGWQGEFGYAK